MSFHLKEFFVEADETKADPKPEPVRQMPRVPDAPVQGVTMYTPVPADVTPDDNVYRRLASKTDFSASPTFQTLNKFLTPLAGLALDDKTKFKIAVQQAQANGGVEPQDILSVFDAAQTQLQKEAESFVNVAAATKANRVDTANQKASDLSAQIQSLQAQVAQLTNDAFQAQQKLQAAQYQFDNALRKRQQELTQEQAKYQGLLS